MKHIKWEKEGAVGILTIDRPKALNALNMEVLDDLEEVLEEVENQTEIRAVIVTGSGQKAFVAGADIAAMKEMDPVEGYRFVNRGQEIMFRIESSSVPFIAAVNGIALGGGLELVLACDMSFVSKEAQFGLPEIKLGLIPGFGGTQRLSLALGKAKSMELILTGNNFSAQEALEWGLVNNVVEPDELLAEAKKMAQKIAEKGGTALACAKQSINYHSNQVLFSGLQFEASQFALAFSVEDRKEGIEAFLEKRKPEFNK